MNLCKVEGKRFKEVNELFKSKLKEKHFNV